MTGNPPIPRRADMRRSVADGCAFALMMGFGQDYHQTYALALGHGERLTSSLLSLSPFLGSLVQLAGPAIIERLGSHRRWVVICNIFQSLSFVPLIIGALLGVIPAPILIAAIALYHATGLAAGAAWSTWMATIIPPASAPASFPCARASFWFVNLAATLAAGWLIAQPGENAPRYAFAAIFFLALCGRAASAWFVSHISEPTPIPEGHRHIPIGEMAHKLLHGHDGRLMGYLMLIQMACFVSLPFLNPWVIGALEYPPGAWAWCAAALIVGRILALYALPDFINRRGTKHTLMCPGVALVPIHLLLLVSSDLKWILAVQLLAGAVQAAFDMAQWLLLVQHTKENERTAMFSIAYFFNAGLMPIVGWLIGMAILTLGNFRIPGTEHAHYTSAGYLWVFALGGALRLLTLIPMWTWVRRLPDR